MAFILPFISTMNKRKNLSLLGKSESTSINPSNPASYHTPFRPAWWLKNCHLQSIWSAYFRKNVELNSRKERFELIDGDFIDAVWVGPKRGPIVVVLHGLEGSIESSYANAMLSAIENAGWRALFIHFRNCSTSRNRLDRYYHIGDTGDIMNVLSIIRNREPDVPLAGVGFSLGGNVLLKWLGEMGQNCPLLAGAAVSVPFKLATASDMASRGLSKYYEKTLLSLMKKAISKKFHDRKHPPIDITRVMNARSFREFDDTVTAPLHGFKDAGEYYQKSSSCFYLSGIRKPTLVIHAEDDPLVPPEAVPELSEFSKSTSVELYPYGGHLGFVSGNIPGVPEYWLEDRVIHYLKNFLPC
ncbi:MAG: hydrolase [Pseudomonadota bacterium]|nr:hydrolase [Pseudomonadota bacterium]